LSGHGSILELSREPQSWAVMAGLLGREILRRTQAESRAHEAEKVRAAAEADATLGRYMTEMRHNVNNALTAILGNAELLLLEPGLPANVLAQADTVRNMALRLHEVFQRFSSIEKELTVAARESGKKVVQSRAAASGI
jgi:signal transduction histidine kinase